MKCISTCLSKLKVWPWTETTKFTPANSPETEAVRRICLMFLNLQYNKQQRYFPAVLLAKIIIYIQFVLLFWKQSCLSRFAAVLTHTWILFWDHINLSNYSFPIEMTFTEEHRDIGTHTQTPNLEYTVICFPESNNLMEKQVGKILLLSPSCG